MVGYTTSDTFLSDFFHFDQETVDFYDQKCALERLGIQIDRVSRDKKKHNSGNRLVEICKNHNLSILRTRPQGWGPDFQRTSVIDYAIASVCSMKVLHDFQINDTDRLCSDGHAFLMIEFSKRSNIQSKSPSRVENSPNHYFKPVHYQSFIDNINKDSVNRIRDNIQSHGLDVEKENITSIVGQISDLLTTSASITQGPPLNFRHDPTSKPWFGRECKSARTKYHLAKKIHKQKNTEVSKHRILNANKSYKTGQQIIFQATGYFTQ